MEEYADKIIYIIIAIVVFAFKSLTSTKKQQQKKHIGQQEFRYDEDNVDVENIADDIPMPEDSLEAILKDKTGHYTKEKKESEISQDIDNDIVDLDEFSLRDAVIYSEILNKKY